MGGAAGCLAMMITISTSGGIGGFGLAKSAEVAVDNLPEPLQGRGLREARPGGARGARPDAGARGRRPHRLSHRGGRGGRDDELHLPETALPAATLDLIDELLSRQRAEASNREADQPAGVAQDLPAHLEIEERRGDRGRRGAEVADQHVLRHRRRAEEPDQLRAEPVRRRRRRARRGGRPAGAATAGSRPAPRPRRRRSGRGWRRRG